MPVFLWKQKLKIERGGKGVMKPWRFSILILLVLLANNAYSKELVWKKLKVNSNAYLVGVACNPSGKLVAVGKKGVILKSNNGQKWLHAKSGIKDDLIDVIWGGGRFVAVGLNGAIVTSKDGDVWVKQKSHTNAPLVNVDWSGGYYVAVGTPRSFVSSKDGVHWNAYRIKSTGFTLRGIGHDNNGTFVAVGFRFPELEGIIVAIYPKEASFQVFDIGKKPGFEDVLSLDDGRLVFATWHGIATFGPSGWRLLSVPTEANLMNLMLNVASGAGYVVAVGDRGVVLSSHDGDVWRFAPKVTDNMLEGIAYCKHGFVAVGANGTIITGR